jgi:iron-sulfur cluster assembly protein
MIALTDSAIEAVKNAMAKAGKPDAGFRVRIENGGCAGMKYMVGLDSKPREDDTVLDAGGVRVFVDAGSAPMLSGVTVDFIDMPGRAGFSFENPNAEKKCNCGKSFC